ncbi:zinc finger protein 484-like [Saccostrea echinata]|uniref:zinc finger protein 484-like n=1 Tax=Saccostrea echinata TaxID=191078 RepID=UPI002A827FBB|nr:zinc finger protein 484-like [Saccostrea echinata]
MKSNIFDIEYASSFAMQVGYDMENVKQTKEKHVHCPHCKYSTDRKNNLKRHIVTMHQDSSKILECCDTVFKSKALLREHVLLNHRSGYICKICRRNFCRKALLRRHLSVHNGQKDFRCSMCSYATSHKSNLERHQKVHNRPGEVPEITEKKDFSYLKINDTFQKSCPQGKNNSKQQRQSPLARKMHTKIVAKYQSLFHRCESFLQENKQNENETQANISDTFHDDSMNQVRTETMERQKNPKEHYCIYYKTSVKRLSCMPYKCSLCNNVFTSQRQEQVHSCVHIKDDLPDVPIMCMILKGIAPENKYHL